MNSYTEREVDKPIALHSFIPAPSSPSKAKTPKDVLVVSILFGILGLSALNSLGLIALTGAYLSLASRNHQH